MREDIPLIANAILTKLTRGVAAQLDAEAVAALERYPFPGNVRELENILERGLSLAADPQNITAEDLHLTPVADEGRRGAAAGREVAAAGLPRPRGARGDQRGAGKDALQSHGGGETAGHHVSRHALPDGAAGHQMTTTRRPAAAAVRIERRRLDPQVPSTRGFVDAPADRAQRRVAQLRRPAGGHDDLADRRPRHFAAARQIRRRRRRAAVHQHARRRSAIPTIATIAHLKVSAHFFVRRDGSLVQFVPCALRAWHAGVSSWRGRERCNDFSVGIELEGTDDLPYATPQYAMLARVARALCRRYPIRDMVGHSDIAPGRKTDPGPAFDWTRLGRCWALPPTTAAAR